MPVIRATFCWFLLGIPLTLLTEEPNVPLSLEEAIGLGLAHNRSLMGEELAAEDARWQLEVEKSVFDLQAGPQVQAGRRDGEEVLDAGIQVRKAWDQGFQMEVDSGYSDRTGGGSGPYVRVRASQFLFRRAGRLVNREPIRQADRNWMNARRLVALRQQQLVLDVIQSYEAALQAERQAQADLNGLERRKRQLARTRARESGGLATRLDTLRAELQVGEAELRVNTSQEVVRRQREDLSQLLGNVPRAEDDLESLTLLPPVTLSVEDALQIALTNRLDIARARDRIEDAVRGEKVAQRSLLPDMSIRVETNPVDPSEPGEDWEFSEDRWFVGLALEPDLSPMDERADVARAENLRKRVQLAWDQLLYDVRTEIRQALRQEARTRIEVRQANQNLELAAKRLRLATARFRLGQTPSETVSDAEEELVSAESRALAARAEASLAGYELLTVIGTLVEPPDDLVP